MAVVPAVGILPLSARGAEIRGTVTVPAVSTGAEESTLNPYAGTLGSTAGGGATTRPSTPEDVVVYVETTLDLAPPADVAAPRLVQRNQQFHPRVLGIPAGTTVDFPNEDLVFHNVFSYSSTRRFDLGYYGRGKSRSVTFDGPGLVRVFCDIHSNMSAIILVVDSPRVTRPDATGAFALPALPAGEHTVVAWHPELGERRQVVTVGDDGADIDILF